MPGPSVRVIDEPDPGTQRVVPTVELPRTLPGGGDPFLKPDLREGGPHRIVRPMLRPFLFSDYHPDRESFPHKESHPEHPSDPISMTDPEDWSEPPDYAHEKEVARRAALAGWERYKEDNPWGFYWENLKYGMFGWKGMDSHDPAKDEL